MTIRAIRYEAEGVVFDELITFEDFYLHCTPRPRGRGDSDHTWSLTFRDYPVAPYPESKQYQIYLNGYCQAFGEEHVVLVAEQRKVLIRNKSVVDTSKILNTDQKEESLPPNERPFRREEVFEAMHQSDFKRTRSCCDVYLGKMCSQDEYRGDLEFFVKTYLRIAGYRK